jgi:hypothetical protein
VATSVLPWSQSLRSTTVKRTRKMSWSSRVTGMINDLVAMHMVTADILVMQDLGVNISLVCHGNIRTISLILP